ncbi:unnamed protein product [Blepharisma stoltei]|uniref:Uncharacterized protein n=1 Tax=Blepharisma stoltei TaxID=1481888 RepID=A0AAU9IG33_9CILI|nr:unnamed protein product [Blepharisma stoltei]
MSYHERYNLLSNIDLSRKSDIAKLHFSNNKDLEFLSQASIFVSTPWQVFTIYTSKVNVKVKLRLANISDPI